MAARGARGVPAAAALLWPVALVALGAPGAAGTASGALKLDNYTLDKTLSFPGHTILVKVDKSYAYGEKEDEFKTLAKLSHKVPKFLVGDVPVQEYGDKENDDIRERFKLVKEDFPVYFLFNEAHPEGLRYTGPVKAGEIAVWLRKNGIKMPAVGTIAELDEIVEKFLTSKGADHIAAAKALAEGEFKGDKKAPMYVKFMEKVKDKGDGFIQSERDRLTKILEGKLSEEQRQDMQEKLQVLAVFVA